MSSISPSLGDISSQLLLPPRLSMSGGGGDLLLECFGSGSPSNVRAVTTGKVPKEALLNRSWLGACCFQALPGASLGTGGARIPPGLGSRRCWDKPPALHPLPSGGLRVTGVPLAPTGTGTRPRCAEGVGRRGARGAVGGKSLANPFVSPQTRACTNNDGTIPALHIDPVL